MFLDYVAFLDNFYTLADIYVTQCCQVQVNKLKSYELVCMVSLFY